MLWFDWLCINSTHLLVQTVLLRRIISVHHLGDFIPPLFREIQIKQLN